MPPCALCEKSVKKDVSPVSTLEPDVLPKTVLAFSPPEVIIPCSKLAKLILRLFRKNIHAPPNKTSAAPMVPNKGKSKPSNTLNPVSGITAAIGSLTACFESAAGLTKGGSIVATTGVLFFISAFSILFVTVSGVTLSFVD